MLRVHVVLLVLTCPSAITAHDSAQNLDIMQLPRRKVTRTFVRIVRGLVPPRATRREPVHAKSESVGSQDCHALNITAVKRHRQPTEKLGLVTAPSGTGMPAYVRGHYPYQPCDASHSRLAPRPVILLMVASHAFRGVVPHWASEARAAGISCVLGSIGSNSSACALAEQHGCRCLRGSQSNHNQSMQSQVGNGDLEDLAMKWGGHRKQAVRQRFEYARQLLEEGGGSHSILMHDGDVFFRPGGLVLMLNFVRSAASMDFVISHNGHRTVDYDDLNWGMVWISGSIISKRLLSCVLSEWDHASFTATGSYWQRSQPRLNHLIEVHLENSARADQMRLCTLPVDLVNRSFRHMSSVPTARSKIICAVALGLLPTYLPAAEAGTVMPGAALPPALAYTVPATASAKQQQLALGAAIILARERGRAVALPMAFKDGKPVPFCSLFVARAFPPETAVLAPTARCAPSVGPASLTSNQSGPISGGQGRGTTDTLCMDFSMLLQRAASTPTALPVIPVCPLGEPVCRKTGDSVSAHTPRTPSYRD